MWNGTPAANRRGRPEPRDNRPKNQRPDRTERPAVGLVLLMLCSCSIAVAVAVAVAAFVSGIIFGDIGVVVVVVIGAMSVVVVVSAPLMDDSTQRLTRLASIRIDSTRLDTRVKNYQNNKMCMRLAIFALLFWIFLSVETIVRLSVGPTYSIPVGGGNADR